MFFNAKKYIHGSRGYVNQIFKGLSLNKMVRKRLQKVVDQMVDLNFKSLITSFDKENRIRNGLLKPIQIDLYQLGESVARLLKGNGLKSSSVLSSERAFINHLGNKKTNNVLIRFLLINLY